MNYKFTPAGHRLAHGDHGLTKDHLELIDIVMPEMPGGKFVKQIPVFPVQRTVHYIPDGYPRLTCELYGPTCGDYPVSEAVVFYRRRNNRPGLSRCVNWEPRPADYMALITTRCKHTNGILILTAYGCMTGNVDNLAPREWWDVGMKPYEARKAADFWCSHALAMPELKHIPELDYLETRFANDKHIVEIADLD